MTNSTQSFKLILTILVFSVRVNDVIWCEPDSNFLIAFADGIIYLANKEAVVMSFEKQLVC